MQIRWIQTLISCGLILLGVECIGAESLSPVKPMETARSVNGQPADRTEVCDDIGDVQLDATGLLRGVVINLQGIPVANTVVSIRRADGKIVRAATDAFGCFSVDGLSEGDFRLTTGRLVRRIRTWVSTAAPPRAGQLALIVLGDSVVRGNGLETESGSDNTVLRTGMRQW